MRLPAVLTLSCFAMLFVPLTRSAPTPVPSGVFQKASLTVKIGEWHVAGKAFEDVINQLEATTDQKIFVNWRTLKASHVTKDLPVTVDFSGLTLGQALDRLLDHVGGVYAKLGYAVDDNVITISIPSELEKNVSTRIYDIRSAIVSDPSRATDVAAIIRRVEGIDPLSWRDRGGPFGSISELNGQLIVTQTSVNQEKIVEELHDVLPAVPKPS